MRGSKGAARKSAEVSTDPAGRSQGRSGEVEKPPVGLLGLHEDPEWNREVVVHISPSRQQGPASTPRRAGV
jgi:hypothetical protein